MKLPKVRNSGRNLKILTSILCLVGFAVTTFGQTAPAPKKTGTDPTTMPPQTRQAPTTGTYPAAQPKGNYPITPAEDARTVDFTEEDTKVMTHEDSIRTAIELQETEDIRTLNLRRKIFGYKLFNGQTYDPNSVINIPTPNNYVFGTGDKLIVDVSGYSVFHDEVKVNAEGYVNIKQIGSVKVGGSNIQDATAKIRASLSRIILGLNNGLSTLKISLGDVRSIKITISGEAVAPGTYTMSSLSTVFNALYRSGGPNELGSFREIKLIRNNKVVATLDLYDYLINGFSESNLLLHDQDVILIPTYKNRVMLYGEMKRNGYFEMLPSESLANALAFAGGYAPKAYQHLLKVYRNNTREREIFDIPKANFEGFLLQSGDSVVVAKVLERFTNLVSISGAVYRPGEYSLATNSTLKTLIGNAEGLMTDALLGRILITRTNEDLTSSNISVNYLDILEGRTADIPLKREDKVIVPSKFELTEETTITIKGAINNENAEEGVELPYVKDMSVEDVLVQVGGLTEAASPSRIEVLRRKKNVDITQADAQISEILQIEVSPDLKVVKGHEYAKLQPYDQLFVRKSPNYEVQKVVEVEGEVFYPGKYGIQSKEERVSDFVRRSGGLTLQAYVQGATLVRTVQLSEVELRQKQKTQEDLLTKNDNTQKILLDEVKTTTEDMIGINLEKILKDPGSDEDLILHDGDILRIPKKLQTVRIQGEVLHPTTVKFSKDANFKDYISGSGGFTKNSLRRKSYIQYPNGSINRTHKFLVFNLYPRVEPGAEIIVPQKLQNGADHLAALGSILGSVATILGTMFGIYGLVQLNKKKEETN